MNPVSSPATTPASQADTITTPVTILRKSILFLPLAAQLSHKSGALTLTSGSTTIFEAPLEAVKAGTLNYTTHLYVGEKRYAIVFGNIRNIILRVIAALGLAVIAAYFVEPIAGLALLALILSSLQITERHNSNFKLWHGLLFDSVSDLPAQQEHADMGNRKLNRLFFWTLLIPLALFIGFFTAMLTLPILQGMRLENNVAVPIIVPIGIVMAAYNLVMFHKLTNLMPVRDAALSKRLKRSYIMTMLITLAIYVVLLVAFAGTSS